MLSLKSVSAALTNVKKQHPAAPFNVDNDHARV